MISKQQMRYFLIGLLLSLGIYFFVTGLSVNLSIYRLLTGLSLNLGSSLANPQPPKAAANQLTEAAKSGDLEKVKALIAKGADPNQMNDSGQAAIHLASAEGHKEIVAFLLDHKANINLQDKTYQATALMEAAQFGRLDVVKLLLNRGAAIDRKGKFGFTALSGVVGNVSIASQKTSEEQAYEIIRLLLAHGADPNSQQTNGQTMLHMPAYGNDLKVVSFLLKHKVNPELKTKDGETALDYCCRGQGDLEMFELLSKAGYKPAKGIQKCLDGAVQESKIKLVHRLLESSKPDSHLLATAAAGTKANDEEIALLILKKCSDVNAPSYNNLTALHGAAVTNKSKLAAALLQKQANMNTTAFFIAEGTPLHLAARFGHPEIVEQLLAAGANVDAKNSYGKTALFLAVEGPIDYRPSDGPPPDESLNPDYLKVIEILLQKGAKKDLLDSNGKSISDFLSELSNAKFKAKAKVLLQSR